MVGRTPGEILVVYDAAGHWAIEAKEPAGEDQWKTTRVADRMRYADAVYFSAAPKLEATLRDVLIYLEETMDSPEAVTLYKTIEGTLSYARRNIALPGAPRGLP